MSPKNSSPIKKYSYRANKSSNKVFKQLYTINKVLKKLAWAAAALIAWTEGRDKHSPNVSLKTIYECDSKV